MDVTTSKAGATRDAPSATTAAPDPATHSPATLNPAPLNPPTPDPATLNPATLDPATHARPARRDDRRHVQLPDKPLVSIRPARTAVSLGLRELWAYRELAFFLAWRDVKVRYKQTALGAAWAILQPLSLMLVFALFFGRLAGLPSDGVPYPLFAYAGLLPWTFFSNAVSGAGNSIVGSSHLVTKVYFPRMIIPGAAVAAGLADLLLGLSALAPLMLYYGARPGRGLLLLPALILLAALLALGVGMWMSALNVRYRDVRFALPFLVQLWMFASPVIYPLGQVPGRWRLLLSLNPMAGVVEGFRSALLGRPFHWAALAVSAVSAVVLLLLAARSFRRMERSFADIV